MEALRARPRVHHGAWRHEPPARRYGRGRHLSYTAQLRSGQRRRTLSYPVPAGPYVVGSGCCPEQHLSDRGPGSSSPSSSRRRCSRHECGFAASWDEPERPGVCSPERPEPRLGGIVPGCESERPCERHGDRPPGLELQLHGKPSQPACDPDVERKSWYPESAMGRFCAADRGQHVQCRGLKVATIVPS
jgi:hypothetical protein